MTKGRGILPPRRFLTDDEVELLVRLYPDTPTARLEHRIAKALEMKIFYPLTPITANVRRV